ncbi:MAG: SUMF1/EgtB/PvdO family nonheme iron enzyme [Candidatus Hydrogenedentes bacterium]|nr:SUMF1/EgtB/PvdO family nonheme iron enzyme [Candidatus Hydrogenedentota bacterium]
MTRFKYTTAHLLALAMLAVSGSSWAEPPQPGDTREILGITFAWCPPGSYERGNDAPAAKIAEEFGGVPEWYSDADPKCTVNIASGFWIGIHEVTAAQWNANAPDDLNFAVNSKVEGSENLPLAGQPLANIRKFIAGLTEKGQGAFRLPTEDEWEYACRAGLQGRDLPEYDETLYAEHAWYAGNMRVTASALPVPAGTKKPNNWGIYDMLGNVAEWCDTPYMNYHCQGPANSDLLPASTGIFVVRGGSFLSTRGFARAAARAGLEETKTSISLGFRLVVVTP